MSVHLTRIYTKTGDAGTTALGDMSRIPKTSPRLAAYADVDEANTTIGVALALGAFTEPLQAVLLQAQNDLFDVGADLCVPWSSSEEPGGRLRVTEAQVTHLEGWCDEYNADLPKLNSFILPGGAPGAALLHQARAVTRRAERAVWRQLELEPETTHAVPARYLNRLSDLLFILARSANAGRDVLWRPGASGVK
jgi:cob(I)alamin adenosyltransferase